MMTVFASVIFLEKTRGESNQQFKLNTTFYILGILLYQGNKLYSNIYTDFPRILNSLPIKQLWHIDLIKSLQFELLSLRGVSVRSF